MKVLVADKFEQSGLDGLRAAGCEVVFQPDLKDDALTAAIAANKPDALIVRSTKVSAEMLAAGPLNAAPQRLRHVDEPAGQGSRICPTLAKRELQVSNRGPLDLDLDVVPGRRRPVRGRHPQALRIAEMAVPVPAPVAKVDSADKSRGGIGPAGAPDDDQLLVVGTNQPDSHVEQDLTANGIDHVTEVAILPGAEACQVAM